MEDYVLVWLAAVRVCNFSFFFSWFAEDEEGEEEEGHYHNAHGYQRVGEALRGETHEEQHGETESEGWNGLEHQVIGGGSLETRVNLAEQYHAVRGCASEHAEHGEECLVGVVGVEPLAATHHVEEGDNSTYGTNQDERQPERTQVVEIDGSGAGNNHEVETGAGYAVEGVVVDILALHEVALAETADNPLDEDTQKRTPEEVEAPYQRLEGLDPEVAQVELLDAEHQEEHQCIYQQHQAYLDCQLVDGFRVRYLTFRLVVGQCVVLHMIVAADVELAATAQNVHEYYTHKATDDEACRSDAEAKVGAVEGDALVGSPLRECGAEIERLSRTLAVAHGEEHAGRVEEVALVYPKEERHRDEQSGETLQDVGAGSDGACLNNFDGCCCTFDFLVFQCHGHKAKTKGMVGDYLHDMAVDEL